MSDSVIREFPAVEWDDDGYPTEESLTALHGIEMMAFGVDEAGRYLRRTLAECAEHCCASYYEEPGDRYGTSVTRCFFSTGGWSGAEDLIDEMLSKFWIRHLHAEWKRGGHYTFEVP